MSRPSLVDQVLNQEANSLLWRGDPAERAVAATFLRLGDQLQAQLEGNEIQRELCGIALQTNALLSDMQNSLGELLAAHNRTNTLLAKSLAVQTQHFMLDKRERVLKDALFRWSEILARDDHASDPHWLLIASRTLLAFLSQFGFTTEDLQDAKEKRSLLQLTTVAKANIDAAPQPITREVDLFQALYCECRSFSEGAESREPFVAPRSTEWNVFGDLVATHMKLSWPSDGPWGIMDLPDEYLLVDGQAMPAPAQRAVLRWAAARLLKGDEAMLFGMYARPVVTGVREFLRAAVFGDVAAIFTTRRRYTCSVGDGAREDPRNVRIGESGRLEYRVGFHPLWEGKEFAPKVERARTRAEGFTRAMAEHWRDTRKRADILRQDKEALTNAKNARRAARSREARERAMKLASIKSELNAFLDLHPGVEQFYPRL